MKKIVVFCVNGMSSGLIAENTQKAADVEGYEAKVYEFALAQATEVVNLKPDCVLVSPQVRYRLDKISEQMPCPVAVIDMLAFGRMDGAKALAQAKELMGE